VNDDNLLLTTFHLCSGGSSGFMNGHGGGENGSAGGGRNEGLFDIEDDDALDELGMI
jgi:hypothetical protein